MSARGSKYRAIRGGRSKRHRGQPRKRDGRRLRVRRARRAHHNSTELGVTPVTSNYVWLWLFFLLNDRYSGRSRALHSRFRVSTLAEREGSPRASRRRRHRQEGGSSRERGRSVRAGAGACGGAAGRLPAAKHAAVLPTARPADRPRAHGGNTHPVSGRPAFPTRRRAPLP